MNSLILMELLLDRGQLGLVLDQVQAGSGQYLGGHHDRLVSLVGLAGIEELDGVGGGPGGDHSHPDAAAGQLVHHVAEVAGAGLFPGRADAGGRPPGGRSPSAGR